MTTPLRRISRRHSIATSQNVDKTFTCGLLERNSSNSQMDIEIDFPHERRRSKRMCVINQHSEKSNEENSDHLFTPKTEKRRKKKSISGEHTVEAGQPEVKRKRTGRNTSDHEDENTVRSTIATDFNLLKIQEYYLDNTVQIKNTTLETIFEENLNLDASMSRRKKKRYIPFSEISEKKARRNSECIKKMNHRKRKSVDTALQMICDI